MNRTHTDLSQRHKVLSEGRLLRATIAANYLVSSYTVIGGCVSAQRIA